MSGSTIPAALTALVTTLSGVLPGVQVIDGPIYDPTIDHLAVGWAAEGENAVDVTRDIADAGRRRDQEDYDVHCLLSMHDSKPVATVRANVFAALELIYAAIDANPTLGGAVSRARISEYGYLPALTEGGTTVSVRFAVNVLAWK